VSAAEKREQEKSAMKWSEPEILDSFSIDRRAES